MAPKKVTAKSPQKTSASASSVQLRRSKRLKPKDEEQPEVVDRVENQVKQKTSKSVATPLRASKRKVKEESPEVKPKIVEQKPKTPKQVTAPLRESKRKAKSEEPAKVETIKSADKSNAISEESSEPLRKSKRLKTKVDDEDDVNTNKVENESKPEVIKKVSTPTRGSKRKAKEESPKVEAKKVEPKSPKQVTAPLRSSSRRGKVEEQVKVETDRDVKISKISSEEPTKPLRKSKKIKTKSKVVEEEEVVKDLTEEPVDIVAEEAVESVVEKAVEVVAEEPVEAVAEEPAETEAEPVVADEAEDEVEIIDEEPVIVIDSESDVDKEVDIEIDDEKQDSEIKEINEKSREERDIKPKAKLLSGEVYSFGDEIAGELGTRESSINGIRIKKNEPSIVSDIDEKVVQVVCGAMHTICLTINGDVITFGCNDDAALGRQTVRIETNGSNLDESNDSMGDSEEKAQKLPKTVSGLPKIVKTSAGDMHTVALSDDGSVYLWGNFKDDSNKLGLFHDSVKKVDSDDKPMNDYNETHSPKRVEGLESTKIVDIASGCHHILLLTENGDVLSFGEGSKGQLGRIPKEKLQSVSSDRNLFLNPEKVQFDGSVIIKKIWSAHWSSFAQSDSGDIYVWGLNNFHQLGFKTENPIELLCTDPNESQQSFNIIAELKPIKSTKMPPNVEMIANGQQHTLVLDTSGQVFSCGSSTYGKLGLSESIATVDQTVDTPRPISRDAFNGESVSHIACGEFCSFAITESGRFYSWGQGSKQIGTNEFSDRTLPGIVKGQIIDSTTFLSVSSGSQHTVLVGRNLALNGN